MKNLIYEHSNSESKWNTETLKSLKDYTSAGFSNAEFTKIFSRPNLFLYLHEGLKNLAEAEKITALQNYKNQLDWADLESINYETSPLSDTRDIRLDKEALENNPYFKRFTVDLLRKEVKDAYPSLEQWQVNISAGVALEAAYAYTTGYKKGFK